MSSILETAPRKMQQTTVEVNKGTDQTLRERGRVALSFHNESDIPESITRLGSQKVDYLIKGIGQLKKGTQTLELFGGSGLSTALLAKQVGAHNLVSVDLHNSFSGAARWRYEATQNYSTQQTTKKVEQPLWISASADTLPFADESFEAVVAPDAPRTATERFEGGASHDAGVEVVLTADEQQDLAYNAATESYRVLQKGGSFVATLPYSVAHRLKDIGYSDVKIFSDVELGDDVTVVPIGRKLAFRTRGAIDPVVYTRCIK